MFGAVQVRYGHAPGSAVLVLHPEHHGGARLIHAELARGAQPVLPGRQVRAPAEQQVRLPQRGRQLSTDSLLGGAPGITADPISGCQRRGPLRGELLDELPRLPMRPPLSASPASNPPAMPANFQNLDDCLHTITAQVREHATGRTHLPPAAWRHDHRVDPLDGRRYGHRHRLRSDGRDQKDAMW
jgi:hypothetical protein